MLICIRKTAKLQLHQIRFPAVQNTKRNERIASFEQVKIGRARSYGRRRWQPVGRCCAETVDPTSWKNTAAEGRLRRRQTDTAFCLHRARTPTEGRTDRRVVCRRTLRHTPNTPSVRSVAHPLRKSSMGFSVEKQVVSWNLVCVSRVIGSIRSGRGQCVQSPDPVVGPGFQVLMLAFITVPVESALNSTIRGGGRQREILFLSVVYRYNIAPRLFCRREFVLLYIRLLNDIWNSQNVQRPGRVGSGRVTGQTFRPGSISRAACDSTEDPWPTWYSMEFSMGIQSIQFSIKYRATDHGFHRTSMYVNNMVTVIFL